jgi:hypothetical protein
MDSNTTSAVTPTKNGRGRPRKNASGDVSAANTPEKRLRTENSSSIPTAPVAADPPAPPPPSAKAQILASREIFHQRKQEVQALMKAQESEHHRFVASAKEALLTYQSSLTSIDDVHRRHCYLTHHLQQIEEDYSAICQEYFSVPEDAIYIPRELPPLDPLGTLDEVGVLAGGLDKFKPEYTLVPVNSTDSSTTSSSSRRGSASRPTLDPGSSLTSRGRVVPPAQLEQNGYMLSKWVHYWTSRPAGVTTPFDLAYRRHVAGQTVADQGRHFTATDLKKITCPDESRPGIAIVPLLLLHLRCCY